MRWGGGAWPGESTTLNSGAFRSDENGLLWLRTLTDSQPQKYYLTLNIGEKPREPNPTKLSQILETEADQKYRLSARACQGILNRAERRGKELPKELKKTLEEQILLDQQSPSKNEVERDEISGTVTAEVGVPNHSGPKVMEVIPMEGNGQRESHCGDGYGKFGDPSFTLNGTEHHGVAKIDCKNPWDPQSARVYGDDSTWHSLNANESGGQSRDAVLTSVAVRLDNTSAPPIGGIEVSPTIRQGAGPNGCANVATYSIQGNTIDRDAKQNGSGVTQDISHTLNSTDRHGVASVDCRNGTENENVNVTLQAKANGGQSLNCGIVIREKKTD